MQNVVIRSHYHIGYLSYIALVIVLFVASTMHFVPAYCSHLALGLALVPIVFNAIRGLWQKKIRTELFLVVAAAIALASHEERAITIVLLIMLSAQYIEKLVERRAERAIESLIHLMPTDVLALVNGRETVLPLADIHKGMTIIIKTGSRIPVDGKIIDGQASVNESFLTGESVPKEKEKPDLVYAGTFVETGHLIVQVTKVGKDTIFSRISTLIEDAERKKAGIVVFADKVVSVMVPLVLVVILAVWLLTGNMRIVMTLLIFGSPLELALVTPLTVLAAVVAAFKNGVLVKGGLALEHFALADTVIFDKTGTLTIGEPEIVDITPVCSTYTARDITNIAAVVEKRSGHVLAKAIMPKALEEGGCVPDPETFESITGHGVIATYQGHRYMLGNKHFIEAPEHGNVAIPPTAVCTGAQQFHTSFYLCCDDTLCGRICTTDSIRPNAKETIDHLKRLGINNIVLLSGDKKEVAQAVATTLGIKTVYGEVFPEDKLRVIDQLQKTGHIVAMIGDGINDAPALKQANVGIAMGAMGMEPAIQAADLVLMANDIHKVVFLRGLSQKTMRLIKQNIFLGLGLTHVVGMFLTIQGVFSPIQAAFIHSVFDLFIVVNAARLIGFRVRE